ncbi:SUZ RNA-binding domain-containing-like isoform X1 [Oscarella lobularis]|uniref:SUZ RNA-binding domain-containing-like isoform X1 n=1 Tax=Oscarella lobularis TaxID=121494 RepID=UPI0033139C88
MDDSDVLDSWEDAADTGELEKRMEERENELAKCLANDEKQEFVWDETLQSTPNVHQIRLLKRSDNPDQAKSSLQADQEQKRPTKSLEEREAEYAEARYPYKINRESPLPHATSRRARIMGPSASQPTTKGLYKPNAISKAKQSSSSSNTNATNTRNPKGPGATGKGFNKRKR